MVTARCPRQQSSRVASSDPGKFVMKTVILSDIHSNYIALKAVISREAPFDSIICVGDFIFGGTQPNEVVSTLKEFDGFLYWGIMTLR